MLCVKLRRLVWFPSPGDAAVPGTLIVCHSLDLFEQTVNLSRDHLASFVVDKSRASS